MNAYKECANCGVTDTPLWRKHNDHDLCNACGIYYRVNGFHRPFLPNMRKLLSSARKMGLFCANCGTNTTSMWRRNAGGDPVCNACGLYFRLNGVKRPVSMRKDLIRKRRRKSQQINGIMRLANHNSINGNNSNNVCNNSIDIEKNQNSTQNQSLLTSNITNQQNNWSDFNYCCGHYSQDLNDCQQQSEQQFNGNNLLNNDLNSGLIPLNEIHSFTTTHQKN